MKRSFVLWVACLAGLCVFSQARNNNWIINGNMWLSWNNGGVEQLPALYNPSPRTASISDTQGDLVLLADDSGIRNALFELIPGGDASTLGWALEQSNYLILPGPGHDGRYYVFLNQREDLKRAGYVVVDVDMNGGIGGVVASTEWYMLNTTAKIAATLDAAETGYWVVLHEDGTDAYYAYHLTATGLDPVPVVSHTGGVFLSSSYPVATQDYWSPMKFSMAGDKLALVKQASSPDTVLVEHAWFDNATGSVDVYARTDNRYITLMGSVPTELWGAYRHCNGLEFDPGGEYLYTFQWDTVLNVAHMHWPTQIPLASGDQQTMQDSTLNLAGISYQDALCDPVGSSIQMGPDGVLYLRQTQSNGAPYPYLQWLVNVPTTLAAQYGNGVLYFDYMHLDGDGNTPMAGFPLSCKRYHDSEPVWLGMQVHEAPSSLLDVWPNPMAGQAVLRMNGNAWPTDLRWYDAMGRCIRSESVRMNGPTVVLERGRLSAGTYVVEALAHGRLIGRAKAVCE